MTLTRKSAGILALAILLLGAGLRIYGAEGNLWLDEISTLTLVSRMHNALAPFLLAHDNNHSLNSLYIYLVGTDASPLWQRGFSIVLGIATIAAAGITLAPRGKIAVLLVMILFAVSFPMVTYGSEARGYSGLILCTILAIHFLDIELRTGGRRVQLALAIFFGLLFHLTMGAAVCALGFAVFADRLIATRKLANAITRTAWIFAPSLLALLVAAIDMAAAIHHTHEIAVGSVTPFSRSYFMFGYGGMIMAMLGSPGRAGSPFGIPIAIAIATLCLAMRQPGDKRPGIYFAFIVVLPLALFVFRVPNAHINRYYLVSGVAFLLCLADLCILAWKQDEFGRKLVIAILIGFTLQTAGALRMFMIHGRSHYADLVAIITANGPTTYGGTSNDFLNLSEVQFYAKRQHVTAAYIPIENYCQGTPQWLIAATEPLSPLPPAPLDWGPDNCQSHYERTQVFPAWGMSGLTVTLYHRASSP